MMLMLLLMMTKKRMKRRKHNKDESSYARRCSKPNPVPCYEIWSLLITPAAETVQDDVAEMRLPPSSLLRTYGQSVPTLLHGATRGKFSSAGCRPVQFGGESAPPWTGDGLWRKRARQEPQPIGMYTGRRCFPVNGGD
ncbi:hypothetical protein Q8A73_016149 [Channa argus]|nr:hypothetical protein Q8A73_016149 [Channa argus]